jgi:hypothetical protein
MSSENRETSDQAKPTPLVLVDGGDDGMDETGWVEKTVDRDEALRLMQVYNPDPELCNIVHDGTAFLRLAGSGASEDWWMSCKQSDAGAREFWRLLAVDRAESAGAFDEDRSGGSQ